MGMGGNGNRNSPSRTPLHCTYWTVDTHTDAASDRFDSVPRWRVALIHFPGDARDLTGAASPRNDIAAAHLPSAKSRRAVGRCAHPRLHRFNSIKSRLDLSASVSVTLQMHLGAKRKRPLDEQMNSTQLEYAGRSR